MAETLTPRKQFAAIMESRGVFRTLLWIVTAVFPFVIGFTVYLVMTSHEHAVELREHGTEIRTIKSRAEEDRNMQRVAYDRMDDKLDRLLERVR